MSNASITSDQVLLELNRRRNSGVDAIPADLSNYGNLCNVIKSIFEQVLVQPSIEYSDNFFEKGGDSLGMIQVTNRLRTLTSVEVDLAGFFDDPTVQGVARIVMQELLVKECKNDLLNIERK